MKFFLLSVISVLLAQAGVCEDEPLKFDELLEYKGVTVTKVEPDGIRIMHESGTTRIPFEKLPEEVRKMFGEFNEEEAEAYRKAKNKAARQYEIALSREMAALEGVKQEREYDKAMDELKMATRLRIKQVTAEGALCSISLHVDGEISTPFTDAFGNKGVRKEKGKVWTADSGLDWVFVTGLPGSIIDGSSWEGWTLVNGRHSYASVGGATKTVRKLKVVASP